MTPTIVTIATVLLVVLVTRLLTHKMRRPREILGEFAGIERREQKTHSDYGRYRSGNQIGLLWSAARPAADAAKWQLLLCWSALVVSVLIGTAVVAVIWTV